MTGFVIRRAEPSDDIAATFRSREASLGTLQIEGTHRAYSLRDGECTDTCFMARLHPRPPRLPGIASGAA